MINLLKLLFGSILILFGLFTICEIGSQILSGISDEPLLEDTLLIIFFGGIPLFIGSYLIFLVIKALYINRHIITNPESSKNKVFKAKKQMKNTKSAILIIAFIFVFSIGFYSGTHYDTDFTHWSTASLKQNMDETEKYYLILNHIDENRMDEIFDNLNSSIDINIIAIDTLLKDSEDSDIVSDANRIIAGIAKYRRNHPFNNKNAGVKSLVEKILNKNITIRSR